jgi:hypothetical protein
MKKIVVVVLLVLMATGMFAEGLGDHNGYDWNTFSEREKRAFTIGVLAGVSYANIVLIGYAADRIPSLTFSDFMLIIDTLNLYYMDTSNLSMPIVAAIVVALNVLRGNGAIN